jgi:hypothetical protein
MNKLVRRQSMETAQGTVPWKQQREAKCEVWGVEGSVLSLSPSVARWRPPVVTTLRVGYKDREL